MSRQSHHSSLPYGCWGVWAHARCQWCVVLGVVVVDGFVRIGWLGGHVWGVVG